MSDENKLISSTEVDTGKTIGDFRLGCTAFDDHEALLDYFNQETEFVLDMGDIPLGTTYSDVASSIIEAVVLYTHSSAIPAVELPVLIKNILESIKEEARKQGNL